MGELSLSEPWKGDVAEFLIYDHILLRKDREALERALAARYGVTLVRE